MEVLHAAALPEAFLTAYDAIFLQGGLQPGQWCLIRAVSSGVGIAACQLVRALGAYCIGTSRSGHKLAALAKHGLHVGVVDGQEPLPEAVRRATEGRGAAVVLDLLGGGHLEENLESLAPGGTLLLVGLLAGARDTLDLGRLMQLRGRIAGTVMRSRPLEEKIALARIFEQRLLPLFERAALVPVLDSVLGLEDVAEAHRRMERNEHLGKIVLRVGGGGKTPS
jgi:NADPH:quinone reductase-like Zn-dependent oxidoreductase